MMTKPDDDNLDVFFAAAQANDARVSDDLAARVLADAASVLATPVRLDAPKRSWLMRALDGVGGWPAMGGVVAAGVCGLWIGIAPPAGIEDFAASLVGNTEQVSLFLDVEDVQLELIDG